MLPCMQVHNSCTHVHPHTRTLVRPTHGPLCRWQCWQHDGGGCEGRTGAAGGPALRGHSARLGAELHVRHGFPPGSLLRSVLPPSLDASPESCSQSWEGRKPAGPCEHCLLSPAQVPSCCWASQPLNAVKNQCTLTGTALTGGAWKAGVPSLSLLSVPLWCLPSHCSGVRELQGVALATWTDVLLGQTLCHLLFTPTPSAASPKLQAGTECCPGGPLGCAVTVLPRGTSGSNATDLAGHRAAGLRLGLLCTCSLGVAPGWVSRDPHALPPAPEGFPPWPASCRGYTAPESSAVLGVPGLAGGCPRLGSPVWGDSHLVPRAKLPCAGLLPTPVSARTPSPHTLGQLAMRARACVCARGAEGERERTCLFECLSDGCVHAHTRSHTLAGHGGQEVQPTGFPLGPPASTWGSLLHP